MAEGSADIVRFGDDETVRLAFGITPDDLDLEPSDDGQHLLIYCGEAVVALLGPMGASAAAVEFADGGRYSVEELVDLLGEV